MFWLVCNFGSWNFLVLGDFGGFCFFEFGGRGTLKLSNTWSFYFFTPVHLFFKVPKSVL